jgi:hypothetical protein
VLPDGNPSELAELLNVLFNEKIAKIRNSITPLHDSNDHLHSLPISQPLTSFGQVTGAELVTILRSMKLKQQIGHSSSMDIQVQYSGADTSSGMPRELFIEEWTPAVIQAFQHNTSFEKWLY